MVVRFQGPDIVGSVKTVLVIDRSKVTVGKLEWHKGEWFFLPLPKQVGGDLLFANRQYPSLKEAKAYVEGYFEGKG